MTSITKKDSPAVFFGGGSAASAVLAFAKSLWTSLTSIHGVFDGGGSTANFLRRRHVALGDMRRAIVALATRTEENAAMYDCMNGRFPEIPGAPYNNDAGGNFILALLSELNGYDLVRAIRMIEKNLGNAAQVMPISLMHANVHSFQESGSIMQHQGLVKDCAEPAHTIMSASLIPHADLYAGAREAILDAGRKKGIFVVTGGSLFDSILAPLLVRGMSETLAEFVSSGGRIIQIVNPLNQAHQSPDFSSATHIEYLLTHIEQESIYAAIVNTRAIPSAVLRKSTEMNGSAPVPYEKTRLAKHTITGDFVTWSKGDGRIWQNESLVKAIYDLA